MTSEVSDCFELFLFGLDLKALLFVLVFKNAQNVSMVLRFSDLKG